MLRRFAKNIRIGLSIGIVFLHSLLMQKTERTLEATKLATFTVQINVR